MFCFVFPIGNDPTEKGVLVVMGREEIPSKTKTLSKRGVSGVQVEGYCSKRTEIIYTMKGKIM